MISIRSSADMARALASSIDANLKTLLALRSSQLSEYEPADIGDLAHFIIVETEDVLATVEGEAGVALAANRVYGHQLGDPDFADNFEFVERHDGGWIEAVIILSDDGFGVVLFVPDRPQTDPALLALVRHRL